MAELAVLAFWNGIMSAALADLSPSLGGWLIIALLAPGLLILIGLVVMFVISRNGADSESAASPGYYHVLGIDGSSGAKREATFHAQTLQGAQGRAEMDGIIVTEIRRVDGEAEGGSQNEE